MTVLEVSDENFTQIYFYWDFDFLFAFIRLFLCIFSRIDHQYQLGYCSATLSLYLHVTKSTHP